MKRTVKVRRRAAFYRLIDHGANTADKGNSFYPSPPPVGRLRRVLPYLRYLMSAEATSGGIRSDATPRCSGGG